MDLRSMDHYEGGDRAAGEARYDESESSKFVEVKIDSADDTSRSIAHGNAGYVEVGQRQSRSRRLATMLCCGVFKIFLPDYYWEMAVQFEHLESFRPVVPHAILAGFLAASSSLSVYYGLHTSLLGDLVPEKPIINGEYLAFVMGATVFMAVFRNGISFGKYWQSAGAMTELVETLQDLARNTAASMRTKETREKLNRLGNLFFRLTVLHVRDETTIDDYNIGELANAEEIAELEKVDKRKALCVLAWMSHLVRTERGEDTIIIMKMEEKIGNLIGCFNAADKLRYTKFPFPFAQLQVWLSLSVIYQLPFVICANYSQNVISAAILAPLVSSMVSFFLLGILAVSIEIEDPFGTEMHDLELTEWIATVDEDVKKILREGYDDEYYQSQLETSALF